MELDRVSSVANSSPASSADQQNAVTIVALEYRHKGFRRWGAKLRHKQTCPYISRGRGVRVGHRAWVRYPRPPRSIRTSEPRHLRPIDQGSDGLGRILAEDLGINSDQVGTARREV